MSSSFESARTGEPRRPRQPNNREVFGLLGTNSGCKLLTPWPCTFAVKHVYRLISGTLAEDVAGGYFRVAKNGHRHADGNTGIVAATDLVDWNLIVTNGTHTVDLTGPLSGNDSAAMVQGADLTAKTSDLFFNFSGADVGFFLLQEPPSGGGAHYYCDATPSEDFWCAPGETVVPASVFDSPPIYQNNNTLTGNVIIGSVPGGAPVPKPSAVILLLTTLLAVAFFARKRVAQGL